MKRFLPVMLAGACLGLMTGLIEAAIVLAQQLAGHPPHAGPHLFWMAPIGNLLWFLPLAVVLLPLHRRIELVLGIMCSVLAFAVLFYLPPIHIAAKLLILAGVGTQTTRLIARHRTRVRAGMPRMLIAVTGIVAVLAVSIPAWQWSRERHQLGKLAPARSGAPNILLLVLDTVRAMSMSIYGYNRPTSPRLAQLAESGVVFDRAYATAPWTLPSHASMFTGRWPQELSADWNVPLDGSFPTLAEALSRRGYLTGGFIGNIFYCGRDFGLGRGFIHYEDYPVSLGEIIVNTSLGRYAQSFDGIRRLTDYHDIIPRKNAWQVQDAFLKWLPADRPFFAFINYFDAHQPYLPPEDYDRRFASNTVERQHRYDRWLRNLQLARPQGMPAPAMRRERDAYDASIAYIDQAIGALLDSLASRGILDNTILIVTSDHGEQFGEHALYGHGNGLYNQVTHVPLIIRFPSRMVANTRVVEPVSLRDLPATVMDLAQIDEDFPGNSLFSGRTSPAASYHRRQGTASAAVLMGDYHSIRQSRASLSIFDVVRDYAEERDLRDSVPHEVIARADSLLRTVGIDFGQ